MNNTNTPEILKSLKSLYTEGKVSDAIKLLQNNESNTDRPLFHYNMGTFLIKDNQMAQARFHLEVAKILGFKPSMVENNLSYVKEKLEVLRLEEPKEFIDSYQLKLEGIQREYIISFFLISILIGLYFYKKFKRTSVLVFFILFSLSLPMAKLYQNQMIKVGIVTINSPLREGPADIYEQTGELPAGLKVFISDIRDKSWYFIESPRIFRGWIELKYLNIIGKKDEKFILNFM